jgi:hypothetical protein
MFSVGVSDHCMVAHSFADLVRHALAGIDYTICLRESPNAWAGYERPLP